jgi:RNA polymerase sigma-70 factor (ECF subfamily)
MPAGLRGEDGDVTDVDGFEDFVREVEPRLRRAFVPTHGLDGAQDATSEAVAWAWEHWSKVETMENPAGYLYRVGQSRTRSKRQGHLPEPEQVGVADLEPELVPALSALPRRQRTAVWLVHACGWTYAETAAAMKVSRSAVGTHVARGLDRLRKELGDESDA